MSQSNSRSWRAAPVEQADIAGGGPVLSRILLWLALGGLVGLFWREIGGLVFHLLT